MSAYGGFLKSNSILTPDDTKPEDSPEMISKEIKNILEGVHYFLIEDLKSESLSGKAECTRRGLLLQLEALREVYPLQYTSKFDPNATIRSASSASMPYLNMEQLQVNNNGSSRMSTSSSGSANYSTGYSNGSSTGYSGDGVVSTQYQNADNATSDFSSENYEDFEESRSSHAQVPTVLNFERRDSQLSRRDSRASSGYDDKETHDDDNSVDVDPEPFRFLIAKCDHHGRLMKRSKGILKTSKSLFGVLTGTLLYLYHKETDDQQRKVIDLTGYTVRDSVEETRGKSRNREFSLELIRPGRKTHTFYLARRKDKEEWAEHLRRAVCCPLTTEVFSGLTLQKPLEIVNEIPRRAKEEEEVEQDEEEDGNDEEDKYDDFYEELSTTEDVVRTSSPVPSALLNSELDAVSSSGDKAQNSNYYTVPEDVGEQIIPNPKPTSFLHGLMKRVPPERPPLPLTLLGRKTSIERPPIETLKQKRPLPEAPEHETVHDGSEGELDDIYCEIDEVADSVNSYFTSSSSLSQEIFDTINERITPLPESNQGPKPDTPSKEEFESYDVPSEVTPVLVSTHVQQNYGTPYLPPKGVPNPQNDCDDSEYKVPAFTVIPEIIYDVPSANPKPVVMPISLPDNNLLFEQQKDVPEMSKVSSVSHSTDYKPAAHENINNVKASADDSSKTVHLLASEVADVTESLETDAQRDVKEVDGEDCFTEENDGTLNVGSPVSNQIKNLCNLHENFTEECSVKHKDLVKTNSTNSVKDIVAKLNETENQRNSFNLQSYSRVKVKMQIDAIEECKRFDNDRVSSTDNFDNCKTLKLSQYYGSLEDSNIQNLKNINNTTYQNITECAEEFSNTLQESSTGSEQNSHDDFPEAENTDSTLKHNLPVDKNSSQDMLTADEHSDLTCK